MHHHGGEQLTNGRVRGLGGGNGPKQGVVGWRPLDGILEGPTPLQLRISKLMSPHGQDGGWES
jgi:hypothetical protein